MNGFRACSVYPEIYLSHCLRGGSIVSNDWGAPRRVVCIVSVEEMYLVFITSNERNLLLWSQK